MRIDHCYHRWHMEFHREPQSQSYVFPKIRPIFPMVHLEQSNDFRLISIRRVKNIE